MLSPPTRLDAHTPLSMGLRPRLPAAASSPLHSKSSSWRPRGDQVLNRCTPDVSGTCSRPSTRADCCRRLRGSTLTRPYSMGLRPRLPAAAASPLHSMPSGWRSREDQVLRSLRFGRVGFSWATSSIQILFPRRVGDLGAWHSQDWCVSPEKTPHMQAFL